MFAKKLGNIFVFVAAMFVTAQGAQLASEWDNGKVVVDGQRTDWGDSLTPIGDIGCRIAVQNDGTFLYVLLVTTERTLQARMLGGGLTFWVDPKGRDEKTFGIQSPSCARNVALFKELRDGTLDDPAMLREAVQASMSFELIRDKGKSRTVYASQEDSSGAQSRLFYQDGELVQELRIPLSAGSAARFSPGMRFGLGIETCNLESDQDENSGRGSWGGGTGSGREYSGGGRGPGRNRGSGGGSQDAGRIFTPVSVWFLVNLSGRPGLTSGK